MPNDRTRSAVEGLVITDPKRVLGYGWLISARMMNGLTD